MTVAPFTLSSPLFPLNLPHKAWPITQLSKSVGHIDCHCRLTYWLSANITAAIYSNLLLCSKWLCPGKKSLGSFAFLSFLSCFPLPEIDCRRSSGNGCSVYVNGKRLADALYGKTLYGSGLPAVDLQWYFTIQATLLFFLFFSFFFYPYKKVSGETHSPNTAVIKKSRETTTREIDKEWKISIN